MQLLGPYNTKLQAFHYEELLQLYKQAIAKGDFAGNATFDETSINTLIQQSQDFATLPLASAEQRVTDDSLNTPLNLLTARYQALVSEANDFDTKATGLISVLEKDTALLDQLLAGTGLNAWLAKQPTVTGASQFSWDYGMGIGSSSSEITQADPSNNIIYPTECPMNTYLDIVDAARFTGLVAPFTSVNIPAKQLQWQWTPMTPGEEAEDLYGDGWAELNLLEDRPLINFLPNPLVQTILPAGGSVDGVFSINGFVAGGSLPIFVRTTFVPRRNQTVITPQNAISDGSFEAGGGTWTLDTLWTIQTTATAHTGTKVAQKAPATAWSSVTTYAIGNVVSYLNKEYISLTNSNLNNLPNSNGSTNWKQYGWIQSQTFPLSPSNRVYVEAWAKNIGANGILNISLGCLDHAGNLLEPEVFIPGITSATDWLEVSEVLQAIDNSEVTFGRIRIGVFGQTTGTWQVDDFRVHLPQNLSAFAVNQDDVSAYIPKTNSDLPLTVFFQDDDFVVDDISNVTFKGVDDSQQITVRYTENYPSYQCSVNETVWSPSVMLDPARPYPDTETAFNPIQIGVNTDNTRSLFPITDETGTPTGLTLKVINRPQFEYYFQVTTPAQQQYGATAILEIDVTKPTFLNGLTLAPFSNFPIRLIKVETESFTTDTRQTVGAANILIDRPMVLTFPTTLVRKLFLTLYQENYVFTEHVVQPPDALRRDTLVAIQSVLPFNVRRPSRATPTFFRGAQYGFGLENIAGMLSTPVLPGIFVAGPNHFIGCPDIYRFDASIFEDTDIDVYLCWKAYNSSGQIVNSELVGKPITIGTCAVWPFPSLSLLDRSTVDHVDIFLKFVFRGSEDVLERYLLQVAGV